MRHLHRHTGVTPGITLYDEYTIEVTMLLCRSTRPPGVNWLRTAHQTDSHTHSSVSAGKEAGTRIDCETLRIFLLKNNTRRRTGMSVSHMTTVLMRSLVDRVGVLRFHGILSHNKQTIATRYHTIQNNTESRGLTKPNSHIRAQKRARRLRGNHFFGGSQSLTVCGKI
jgi:hypothetical protein